MKILLTSLLLALPVAAKKFLASILSEKGNLMSTPNNANHRHAVWPDFDGDFGHPTLGQHFQQDH